MEVGTTISHGVIWCLPDLVAALRNNNLGDEMSDSNVTIHSVRVTAKYSNGNIV